MTMTDFAPGPRPRRRLITRRNRRRQGRARVAGARAAIARALRVLGIALGLSVALAGGALACRAALRSPAFFVRHIDIRGARRADPDALRARVGLPPEASLLTLRLSRVERDVASDPWVARARAYRRLPDTVVVEVVEHPACALALLGHLYLVDAEGKVFKRAAVSETEDLPVVTGLDREGYLDNPDAAHAALREALEVARAWDPAACAARGCGGDPGAQPREPGRRLSEVRIARFSGPTLYTWDGVQVRLAPDDVPARLTRVERVWSLLGPDAHRLTAVLADQRTRPDRVVVRLGPVP